MHHLTTTQETSKAAAAYAAYADMGDDRSFPKLAKLLGKSSGYTRCLEAWSSKYAWQQRIAAHDAAQRETDRAAQAQAEEAQRKHRMELEPKYINIILTRWEAETGQIATLLHRVSSVEA